MNEQELSSKDDDQRRAHWRQKKPSQERVPVPANAEPKAKRLKLIEKVPADSDPQSQADQQQQVPRNG